MDEEKEYTEQFLPEEGDVKVRYIRTYPGGISFQIYLTKDYLEKTEKRIVETYLDHTVEGIMTREEAT